MKLLIQTTSYVAFKVPIGLAPPGARTSIGSNVRWSAAPANQGKSIRARGFLRIEVPAAWVASRCALVLALAVLLASAPAAWALPKIKVLATGGTLAGAQATQTDVGYKSGAFSADNIDPLLRART